MKWKVKIELEVEDIQNPALNAVDIIREIAVIPGNYISSFKIVAISSEPISELGENSE